MFECWAMPHSYTSKNLCQLFLYLQSLQYCQATMTNVSMSGGAWKTRRLTTPFMLLSTRNAFRNCNVLTRVAVTESKSLRKLVSRMQCKMQSIRWPYTQRSGKRYYTNGAVWERKPNLFDALTKQTKGGRGECLLRKCNPSPRCLGRQTESPDRYSMETSFKIFLPITSSDEPSVRRTIVSTKDKSKMWKKAIETELSFLEAKEALEKVRKAKRFVTYYQSKRLEKELILLTHVILKVKKR